MVRKRKDWHMGLTPYQSGPTLGRAEYDPDSAALLCMTDGSLRAPPLILAAGARILWDLVFTVIVLPFLPAFNKIGKVALASSASAQDAAERPLNAHSPNAQPGIGGISSYTSAGRTPSHVMHHHVKLIAFTPRKLREFTQSGREHGTDLAGSSPVGGGI